MGIYYMTGFALKYADGITAVDNIGQLHCVLSGFHRIVYHKFIDCS